MTASVPDTVGYKLMSARRLLRTADQQVEVEQTAPPPPHLIPTGLLRVIQQRCLRQDTVKLIVARQICLGCCEDDGIGFSNGS